MNDDIKEISDKLEDISNQLNEMRQEYTRDKYDTRSYILWAFTVAVLSIYIAIPHPVNIGVAIGFFILGSVMWIRARRVTARQDAGNQMTVGNGRIWRRLARWFEWVFATVLMTTITFIVSLQYLTGCGRVLLIIAWGIFLVATVISQFDQAGWFGRRGGG